jgi:putative ABC transport system ATP-binding protein
MTAMTNVTGRRAILELRDVRRIFLRATADQVIALDGIDLEVYEQDFVTIIGSNGAGKSTLLHVIAGLYPPEKGGKVIINGTDVTTLGEYRRAGDVSMVWQEPRVGTASKLTVEENLSLALGRGHTRGLRSALTRTKKQFFREALADLGLGLEDRLKSQAGTLSGGQRQALAVVMATMSKPAILLLDEHTATLDPRTAGIVLQLTETIVRDEKMTTMMVTHNMELALRYGNRLLMMHRGRTMLDLDQHQKSKLTASDLVDRFEQASGERFVDDSVLLQRPIQQ